MDSSNPQLNKTTSSENLPEIKTLNPSASTSSLSDSSLSKFSPNDNNNQVIVNSGSLDHELSHMASSLSPSFNAATQAPTSQEMDRSTYRIPPSVFERSKTPSPADWSVASCESLFSIHGGNLSFTNDMVIQGGNLSVTNDHMFMHKSGELFTLPETSTPELMFNYSILDQSSNSNMAARMRNQELGLAEATMKEVIKESEAKPLKGELRGHRYSQGSNASIKSYAFAGKPGEVEKEVARAPTRPSSVKSSSLMSMRQEPLEQESQQAEKPKAKKMARPTLKNAPKSKWLPRFFPCCLLL